MNISRELEYFRQNAVLVTSWDGRKQELTSQFEEPVSELELRNYLGRAPKDQIELWSVTRSARLHYDFEFGTCGLTLLGPQESAEETSLYRTEPEVEMRLKEGDAIIGRFRGDGSLIVMEHEGRILLYNFADPRDEWTVLGHNLCDFLQRFRSSEGDIPRT